MTGPLARKLRRIALVARVELAGSLGGPLFYVIALMMVAIVLSIGAVTDTSLALVSTPTAAPSPPLLSMLSAAGYQVAMAPSPGAAREPVLRGEASVALTVRPAQRVEVVHFDPWVRERVGPLVEEQVLRRSTDACERAARAAGLPAPEVPVVVRPMLGEATSRDEFVLGRATTSLWAVALFFTTVGMVLSRSGLSRILRVYSLGEFLAGRFIAGFILAVILAGAVLATLFTLDIRIRGPLALALCMPLFAASAIALGLFCALAPRAVTRRSPDDLLGAFTLASFAILDFLATSGAYFPLCGMSPWARTVAEWLPPAPAVDLVMLTALGGLGLESPAVVDAAVRWAASLAALLAADAWLVRRA